MGLRSLGRLRRKDGSLRWERTSGKTALAEYGAGWWDNQCALIVEDTSVGDTFRMRKEDFDSPLISSRQREGMMGWMEETLSAAATEM